VESAEGQGTTVTCTLNRPALRSDHAAAPPAQPQRDSLAEARDDED